MELKSVLAITSQQDEKDIIENALRNSRHYTTTRQLDVSELKRSSEVYSKYGAVIITDRVFSRKRLDLVDELQIAQQTPLLIFTETQDVNLLHEAIALGISAYVIDGLKRERIVSLLQVAEARFRHARKSQIIIQKSQQALTDRKRIDRAKGLLMSKQNMDEDMAYRTLRNMAMNQNKKMSEVAENVIYLMSQFK